MLIQQFTESVLHRRQINQFKTFFLKRNWLQNNYSNTVSLGRFGKKIIMTMRCYKTIYVYILCMYVQTHIFIISKYEVKDAQVLYYITESRSVRLGKWRRRPIFAINIDIFRFLFLFHQTGFFFWNFQFEWPCIIFISNQKVDYHFLNNK